MTGGSEQNDRSDAPDLNVPAIGGKARSNCWIFVVVDHLIGDQTVSARDILIDRLKQKIWIVNNKNPQVKHLREGDDVVFYLGGNRDPRGFAGIGVLASEPRPLTASDGVAHGSPSSKFDRVVELRDAKFWPRVKPVAKLVPRLRFIKKKRNWGAYLQGGIIRLFDQDFELIMKA